MWLGERKSEVDESQRLLPFASDPDFRGLLPHDPSCYIMSDVDLCSSISCQQACLRKSIRVRRVPPALDAITFSSPLLVNLASTDVNYLASTLFDTFL